jgi:hypothetical protein
MRVKENLHALCYDGVNRLQIAVFLEGAKELEKKL